MLDRNGLRPGRYEITDDGLVVLASEAGVLELDPEHVVTPGIYTDTVVKIQTESGVKEREEREALAAGRPKPCAATMTTAEQAAEGK